MSSTSSIICVISDPVTIDLSFFFIVGHTFLILCVSAYYLLDARHYEVAGYFYISMNILKDSVKLLGNSSILF